MATAIVGTRAFARTLPAPVYSQTVLPRARFGRLAATGKPQRVFEVARPDAPTRPPNGNNATPIPAGEFPLPRGKELGIFGVGSREFKFKVSFSRSV